MEPHCIRPLNCLWSIFSKHHEVGYTEVPGGLWIGLIAVSSFYNLVKDTSVFTINGVSELYNLSAGGTLSLAFIVFIAS